MSASSPAGAGSDPGPGGAATAWSPPLRPGGAEVSRRLAVYLTVIAAALLVAAWTTVERYQRIGTVFPGFFVMENLLVGIGTGGRGELRPMDLVRAVNGRLVGSGRELQDEVARHPAGTPITYFVYRQGGLTQVEVPSQAVTRRNFHRYLTDGLLPGLLVLGLGALVYWLKPGPQSGAFLAFTLLSYLVSATFNDAHTTYRFSHLFVTAWAFWPATFIHLALTFPQRRTAVLRYPRLVWVPYLLSAGVATFLQLRFDPEHEVRVGLVVSVGAVYWGLALIVLVVALARTSLAGRTPLSRQRARSLALSFLVGYAPPVLGTAVEAVFRVPVPFLETAWKLTLVFPAVMAYAMVRYNLFEMRTIVRMGTIYSLLTGVVVLVYAGAIALLDLVFRVEGGITGLWPAVLVAVAVVLLNPLYLRAQRLVDRLFFRQRLDVQASLERVSDEMISLLDLRRIAELIARTVDDLFHPTSQRLLLEDAGRGGFVALAAGATGEEGPPGGGSDGGAALVAAESALARGLVRVRGPLPRTRLEEAPRLRDLRESALDEMDRLGAEVAVPVLFRDRLTGIILLGPKQADAAYSAEDLRLLRLLVNQSAVALEHAKAYAALADTNAELTVALRRVEILESIRSNLSKFVPRTVRALIEEAPEAPSLEKREADVSVLFVDIVGYTRLAQRLDAARVNRLVERYFASFLDEILRRGGDVNETAGDGLMAIFQDPDPRRHARAAVKTGLGILRRTQKINERDDGEEPIAVHVGVNSGSVEVGATKIEGVNGARWTYTASGPVTILAARLAARAEGMELLVGPETHGRLADEFPFEALGEHPFHNIDRPVAVHRLPAGAVAVT